MKDTVMRTLLCTAALALALPAAAADSSQGAARPYNNQSPNRQYNATPSSSQSMSQSQSQKQQAKSGTCSVDQLLGAKAKSRDGQELGKVEDVLINPQTGRVEFVALEQGGISGSGEDRVLIPWQAVSIQQGGDITVNQDKSKLQSAPSAKRDYSDLNQPGYVTTIYEFYAIPVPAATGGSEGPGGSQQQNGAGASTNRNSSGSSMEHRQGGQ